MDSFTVADLLADRARSDGRAIAVEHGDRTISYADLDQLADLVAGTLRSLGVAPGDRVAIFHRNSIETLEWLLGAMRLGAVVVIVNDALKPPQVAHIVRHSGARLLVVGRRLLGQLAGEDLGPVPVTDIAHREPGPAGHPARPPIGGDLAALIYTSGSTGLPKGVMVTHANLLAGARIVARYLGLTTADRTLSILPWSFDAGLNQVFATFAAGGALIVAGSTWAPEVCRALVERRITGLAGVPPLWEILVGRPSPFLDLDLPDLRYVTNTGGVLRAGTLARLRQAHPDVDVVLMYGLTEAFRSTYLPPALVDAHPDSMGLAIPDTEILILDEAGRPCGPDETGELVHSGPTVSAGYWRDPAATAAVFRPHPFPIEGAVPRYVVHSGDYVRRDSSGLLYFVGRRDEQIKSRGFRVSPTEIEVALCVSPLVREVVVFASPGPAGEAEIVAAVVPADPADFDAADLHRHCRATMPAYQWPARIAALAAIPRTASGKLDRMAAKQLASATSGIGATDAG